LTRHGSVASVGETLPDEATKHRIQLLTALKKEVKVIMEEAVTKRQIDINSPYVTSLCGQLLPYTEMILSLSFRSSVALKSYSATAI
uniref:MitMem_reg domain-containing protein n=1 Tax=Haemonchus placei TaxID=6290 RepID=A0A0N4W3E9_HAEPC